MKLGGWGRYPLVDAQACSFASRRELAECLAKGPGIVHALGRSYGDSALAERVVLTRRFGHVLEFDPAKGEIVCEAGVSLAEILETVLPRGWFLPITPGTKYVSVGGAIASDVHGKNHHQAGSFRSCVKWLDLMLPDGSVRRCTQGRNKELFRAAFGGMGLTGVVVAASIRLKAVVSGLIDQVMYKARDLAEAFDLFEAHESFTYSVAWIDCLAKGAALGRSLLMLGEHAQAGPLRTMGGPKLSVPGNLPGFVLNPWSMNLFNKLYYHKVRRAETRSTVGVDAFFYPLDAVGDWNRVYGKGGFVQYQCVLPRQSSYAGMREIVGRIADTGRGSFLAVLKLLGKGNDSPLSFPMEGYTLALDFKMAPGLLAFLDELDKVVVEHGGRLYLTKDARMSAATLRAGYPGLPEFEKLRASRGLAQTFKSLQSERLEI